MSNIEITPLFLVLAAVIGLLIGLLVASLFSTREPKTTGKSTPPGEMAKEGFAECSRLWYSPSGKKIVTELDGEFYREFGALSPDQKKRVVRIVSLWSNWVGKTSEPMVEKIETVEPAKPVVQPAAEPEPAQKYQPISFEPLPTSDVFVDKPVSEMINITPAFIEPEEPAVEKPKTIAGQISQIIGKMLETSPLREKGIKLIENEHQGVDVWIGMEKFDGIDSIPYPEAKQLIKAAVTQWEQEAELQRKLGMNP